MKGEVLVIREPDRFSEILIEAGFPVINLPLIQTEALSDLSELEKRIAQIEKFDGVFLTSPKAAAPFLKKLNGKAFGGKIYVLGERTQKMFEAAGVEIVFSENANTASELLDAIPEADLKGKRFLFPRGSLSVRTIPERLEGIAEVVETIVYETTAIKPVRALGEEIKGKLKKGGISAICFFSPSGAEGFLEQFGEGVLHQTRIATIGKTTAEFFERKGLSVDFVSPQASAEDFAIGLVKYLQNGKRKMENGK